MALNTKKEIKSMIFSIDLYRREPPEPGVGPVDPAVFPESADCHEPRPSAVSHVVPAAHAVFHARHPPR